MSALRPFLFEFSFGFLGFITIAAEPHGFGGFFIFSVFCITKINIQIFLFKHLREQKRGFIFVVSFTKKAKAMKKIPAIIQFNGLPAIKFTDYVDSLGASGKAKIEEIPFKRDLRGWNDGPTAMQPSKCILVICRNRRGEFRREEGSIYQIWENAFGLMDVFMFDFNEYANYSPSDEMPDSIGREIGLCVNYHKGQ